VAIFIGVTFVSHVCDIYNNYVFFNVSYVYVCGYVF
jgi:hypothetical protein